MRHRDPALAAALLLLLGSNGYGQIRPAEDTPSEAVSIGAAGSVGPIGNIGAFRFSAPLAPKWALDLTVGHVAGYGNDTRSGLDGGSFAATARYLWHGRKQSGATGYWLFGPMLQDMTDRTLVIVPGRSRTEIVEYRTVFTLQVGYGWDWRLKNGVRFGFELAAGGADGGANPYVNVFAVWGKPRHKP